MTDESDSRRKVAEISDPNKKITDESDTNYKWQKNLIQSRWKTQFPHESNTNGKWSWNNRTPDENITDVSDTSRTN